MKSNLIRLAAVAALASVAANAATVSFTGYTSPLSSGSPTLLNNGSGLSDGTTSLSVSQFNPSLGTLTGVSYSLFYQGYGEVNINTVSANANFTAGITGGFSQATSTVGGPSTSVTIAPSNFPVPQLSFSLTTAETPSTRYTPTVYNGTSSTVTDNSNLAAYTGTGSVLFNIQHISQVSLTANAQGGGVVTVDQTVLGRQASAVTVTYTYTTEAVPEPSTYAAIGFAGLVAGTTIWRRRQAAKKA